MNLALWPMKDGGCIDIIKVLDDRFLEVSNKVTFESPLYVKRY